jgi:hypothetical protein
MCLSEFSLFNSAFFSFNEVHMVSLEIIIDLKSNCHQGAKTRSFTRDYYQYLK